MALQLEMDEARRHMYLLLRAPEGLIHSEEISKTERIHEALFVFRRTRRLPPGDLVIKKDGCHSPSLDMALKEAVESGEVVRKMEGGVERYSLTDRGLAESKGPWDAAERLERIEAVEAKYYVNDITDRELVSFLYGKFPDTWTDPAMKKKGLAWGFEAACSMYDRAKVSIGGGARMAGMDYESFMRALMAAGYMKCNKSAEEMQKNVDEIINHSNAN
ncbi:MAG: hypothetical protein MPJ05_08540 [Nitrosopumilus sp.]|nr:hypothetical protein [Nitrosopumilus sp.]CAI9832770.1 hypothetical protein IBTHAUMO2_990002 [Nitrosopumilaceae archaeon]MDA7942223.1 hypothetical protein [Nitrosopumilus sp.]MDA7943691.1 hypothetical protein [Nitrosopumilus sp.]MDA7944408.1 hypothetical protein [Nitrosopumilus sp.]